MQFSKHATHSEMTSVITWNKKIQNDAYKTIINNAIKHLEKNDALKITGDEARAIFDLPLKKKAVSKRQDAVATPQNQVMATMTKVLKKNQCSEIKGTVSSSSVYHDNLAAWGHGGHRKGHRCGPRPTYAPSPEEEYGDLFKRMYELCDGQGWGDPFSYARSREIHMANQLGHTIAKDYAGSDAFDAEGNAVEYKSTISEKGIKATYNGISVQPSWLKQEAYLRTEKIGKYQWHYFARYQDGQIQEIWKMSGDKVLELLLPKLKKQYESKNKRKDPRLGTSLTSKEITKYAEKIIL